MEFMLSFMIYESRNLNSAFNSLPIYIQSNQLMSLKVVSAQLREKKAERYRQRSKSRSSEENSNEDFSRGLIYCISLPLIIVYLLYPSSTSSFGKKSSI